VKEIAGLSQYMLGQQLGFSAGSAHRRFKKGDERAKKIREGALEDFKWFDDELTKTKCSKEQIDCYEKCLLEKCALIINNPNKGETVSKRDRKSKLSVIDLLSVETRHLYLSISLSICLQRKNHPRW
jgi:hypothetical protein